MSIFNLVNKRRGLFLVTGATGSGKSTTLASFIDIINKNMYKHIITLEEPIEYLHWHNKSIVSQREIGKDVLDFDTGLRAALREDPDIIMVGEMRDSETINTALLAAETGHFVLSTLHTNGVAETIDRILESFPEKQHKQIRSVLSSVIEGVVSQQLLPRKDGNGYVVACEVMYKTKELQRIIRYESTDKITEYISSEDGFNGNMCTMDSSICNLYFDNLISKDTALDYAVDRKYMQDLII